MGGSGIPLRSLSCLLVIVVFMSDSALCLPRFLLPCPFGLGEKKMWATTHQDEFLSSPSSFSRSLSLFCVVLSSTDLCTNTPFFFFPLLSLLPYMYILSHTLFSSTLPISLQACAPRTAWQI